MNQQLTIFSMIGHRTTDTITHHFPDKPTVTTSSELPRVKHSIPRQAIIDFISQQRDRLTAIYTDQDRPVVLRTSTRSPFHC